MNGIHIDNEGECSPVIIRKTKTGYACNRHSLHVHFTCNHTNVTVFSPVDPRAMQNLQTKIFTFTLPPPLDTHVYPERIYIGCVREKQVIPISLDEFSDLYTKLSVMAQNTDETFAVYDVPAIPFSLDDQPNDEASDDDEPIEEEEPSEEECDDDEDDEEWGEDDDVTSIAP